MNFDFFLFCSVRCMHLPSRVITHRGSRITRWGYWGDLCAQFLRLLWLPSLSSLPQFLRYQSVGTATGPTAYVKSKPHRGLKFCHQKYNPLTPWWNERGSNPHLSGREWAPNPLSHEWRIPENHAAWSPWMDKEACQQKFSHHEAKQD